MAQTSPTEDRITLSHFRRLAGISTATAHRWFANGSLGKAYGKNPVRIDVAAAERALGPIPKDRIERTRRTPRTPGRKRTRVPND